MSVTQLGLFDTPPNRAQARLGIVIVILIAAAFIATLPLGNLPLGEIRAFVPTMNAVILVGELIIAALLYAQASIFRSRALTILATCYVFTALLLLPHSLAFPGAFSPQGLLGGGVSTPTWIYMPRRAAFPLAALLYVWFRRRELTRQFGTERPAEKAALWAVAAIALAASVTLLATVGHDLLPPYYVDRNSMIYSYALMYELGMLALIAAAAITLFLSRRSVLDLWLLVALWACVIQSLLIMTLQGRFTVGLYCLHAMIMVSHLVVLLALIAESNWLYGRLALSTAARERERDARLMSMDAVTAAIAHEVGQPLTGLITNAMAGHCWVTRDRPDRAKAVAALRAVIEAGNRTNEVIKSIRATFAKGGARATEISLNALVRETAAFLERELAGEKVSLELTLDEALPPVLADRVQIQRVLVNLFTNAIDSLGATRSGPRRIAIRSAPLNGREVLLEVSDNGIGIEPEEMTRIFEPFFTTKAKGTGLGLSLCRTIVEEHGGRLWASPGAARGATFHLQLPRGSRSAAIAGALPAP
jgi:signal transduction histidine kinase